MTAPLYREAEQPISCRQDMVRLAESVEEAAAHHQRGDFAEAERIYAGILATEPDHFEALHLLGVLRHQQGRSAEALELLANAIERNARSAEALSNFGVVFEALGCHEEAVAAYDQALALAPDKPDALSNRASALTKMGRNEEALASCEAVLAIDPHHVHALTNRGNALFAQGRYAEAICDYEAVLVLQPGSADACCNQGEALSRLRRYGEALEAFDRALSGQPDHVEALVGRAGALIELGRPDQAMRSVKQALAIEPSHVTALTRRGRALFLLEHHEEALASYDAALAIEPHQPTGLNNRGDVLLALARLDEAAASYQAALAQNPHYFQALNNIGNVFAALDRHDEAERCFDGALTLAPDYATAKCNKGTLYRSCGRLTEGWGLFEHRWTAAKGLSQRPYPQPRWAGGKVDRELVVWGEQGLGDQIIYASMVPDLFALAGSVVLEVEPRLVTLFARSFPRARVVGLGPELYAGDVEAHVPVGSLGRYLRPGFEAFPCRREGYLVADADRAAKLRERLTRDKRKVVGLSWRSVAPLIGGAKTAQLRDFEALLRLPNCRFVDLQYGDTREDCAAVEHELGIRIERLEDIDNTNDIDRLSALMSACDVIATVSNTTAHLAGALGRPTWVFLPFGNGQIWYWFKNRTDSPWYAHARLWRQARAQPWPDLIASAARDISDFISKP